METEEARGGRRIAELGYREVDSMGSPKKRGRRRKKAFSYLRVSTTKQVKREFNPEGISLPQQRQAVKTKADSLEADIEKEFKEEVRSAKSVDQRPEFQRMLAAIKARGDIDYVIVDSLSRANRNRVEDAMMLMLLRQAGERWCRYRTDRRNPLPVNCCTAFWCRCTNSALKPMVTMCGTVA